MKEDQAMQPQKQPVDLDEEAGPDDEQEEEAVGNGLGTSDGLQAPATTTTTTITNITTKITGSKSDMRENNFDHVEVRMAAEVEPYTDLHDVELSRATIIEQGHPGGGAGGGGGGENNSASLQQSLVKQSRKMSLRSSFVPKPRGDRLEWANVNMSVLMTKRSVKASSKSSSPGDTDKEEEETKRNEPETVHASDHNRDPSAETTTTTEKKIILNNVWGEADPFETTAIMGASGAGKTSLFSVLSGHLPPNKKMTVDGDIRVGGIQIDSTNQDVIRKRFAFVGQEDILHCTSTPREAIRFSARLRLARDISNDEIEALVDHYLVELGLVRCADSVIGGGPGMPKGISGGT